MQLSLPCSIVDGHQPNTDDFLSVRTEFNAERKRKLAAGVTRLMLEQHLNDTCTATSNFDSFLISPGLSALRKPASAVPMLLGMLTGACNRMFHRIPSSGSFEEYLAMPEYRDIATRSMVADSPPRSPCKLPSDGPPPMNAFWSVLPGLHHSARSLAGGTVDLARLRNRTVDLARFVASSHLPRGTVFGADSHPYRNVTVDSRVFAVAKTRLLRCKFVGILEAPDTSIKLMQRILRSGARPGRVPGPRSQPGRPAADGTSVRRAGVRRAQPRAATGGKPVRLHSNGDRSAAFRAELKTNVTRQQLMTSMNRYDQRLYAVAKARFCSDLAASGLLDEDPAARQESAGICGVDLHTLIDPGLA